MKILELTSTQVTRSTVNSRDGTSNFFGVGNRFFLLRENNEKYRNALKFLTSISSVAINPLTQSSSAIPKLGHNPCLELFKRICKNRKFKLTFFVLRIAIRISSNYDSKKPRS